ncbi:MAG TPA: hypothetical protein VGI85_12470 [Chthoniobacterales bacterium]|jgi:hypothetical protein
MKSISKIALTSCFAIAALLPFASKGDTITFSIDNVDSMATSVPPSGGVPAIHLTITDLTRANGGSAALVSSSSSSSGYPGASGMNNVQGAAAPGTLDVATSTYFTFALNPDLTSAVVITGLDFGSRSTGTGPTTLSVFSSLDNFTAPVASSVTPVDSSWNQYTYTLALPSGLNTPVSLRIYGGGGTSASSGNWRLDDINVEYQLIPEPSVYMLLGVGLLLCGQRFLRGRKSRPNN